MKIIVNEFDGDCTTTKFEGKVQNGYYKVRGAGYVSVTDYVKGGQQMTFHDKHPRDTFNIIHADEEFPLQPLDGEIDIEFKCPAVQRFRTNGIPVKLYEGSYLEVGTFKFFGKASLIDMEGKIHLSDGGWLIKDYGKYHSGLAILNIYPGIPWIEKDHSLFNLPKGKIEIIYGDFYVSKKGTNCFRIKKKEEAKHILIKDDWGGAYNSYRGRTLPEECSLYYRRASSAGGGIGYDYAVYPKDWKYKLTSDEI